MTRQGPRRPAASRTPVSRPRRVAGQGGSRADLAPVEVDGEVEEVEDRAEPQVEEGGSVDLGKAPLGAEVPEAEPAEPDPEPEPEPDTEDGSGPTGLAALFEGSRVTVVLAVLVVVLALAAAAVGVVGSMGEDTAAAPPPKGEIAVPKGHPIVMSDEQAQQGAAAAAKAATAIVGRTYQDYDKQVAAATALMTDDFAKKYKQTTDDIKDSFVAAKTEVEVRVVAQGVVRANRSQVQALLFLNQYVSKDGGDTTYTPYRALVTIVHTNRGWLVSDLDTQ